MGIEYSSVVDAPVAEVFAWHGRAGALRRLAPPWQPMEVVSEAASLRDGRAVLRIPPGLRWVAEHGPHGDGYGFVDELTNLPLPWRHRHDFEAHGDASTLVRDRVETPVPEMVLRSMFRYRHRQLAADIAAHQWAYRNLSRPLTVAITGSSGLVGSALAAFLSTGGHRVIRLVRGQASGPDERSWRPHDPHPELLDGVDAVVHLAGASIAGRFTPGHKRAIRDSRIRPTRELARLAANTDGTRPALITASAIGYYGAARGDVALTEDCSQGEGFLADVVGEWEAATDVAAEDGVRVVNVRTGIVQTPSGGTLRLLYPQFAAGLGGRLGNGRQWTSWIGLDDLLDVYYRALVDTSIAGPVNAVAPNPVRNVDYSRTLAGVLGRPALLPTPSLGPKLLLGAEGDSELAEASQRVIPRRLLDVGHEFRYPDLDRALRHVLGKQGARESG